MGRAELIFEKISKDRKQKHSWEKTVKSLVAGAAAGAASATIVAPLDLVKSVHKTHPKIYKGLSISKTLQKIYREAGRGVSGTKELWRGNLATVAKLAPAGAISFAVYSALNNQLKKIKL